MSKLVGLSVYNTKRELKGIVTDRHHEGDVEVLVIDDDWEVPVQNVSHILWTLKPDERHEHIRLK